MTIIQKKVSEIIPYVKNPRVIGDEAVEKVANSIKKFGFKNPILIDKNNVIIAGHTRLLASKKLGLDEVPCIVCDDLSDKKVKALRLADNKVAEYSSWDFNILSAELADIDFDMSEFGFADIAESFENSDYINDDCDDNLIDEPKQQKVKTAVCPSCGFEFEVV